MTDWYRNEHWDESTAEAFEAKLKRSRSQYAQYLTLQAFHLLARHPGVALGLLDRAREADTAGFEAARIASFRATANLLLGRIDDLLADYEAGIEAEASGGVHVGNPLDYAFAVAYFRRSERYDRALALLDRFGGSPFLNADAQALGAHALILADLGREPERTAALARTALDQLHILGADETADVGGIRIADFRARLEEIAA
jgi:tetratricopeptide (TPR) repeat protein